MNDAYDALFSSYRYHNERNNEPNSHGYWCHIMGLMETSFIVYNQYQLVDIWLKANDYY